MKPIQPNNLIDIRTAFTNSSSRLTLGTVTSSRAIVLTSLLVAPEFYPSSRLPISLRFCRVFNAQTSCSHSWAVPNDDVTMLNYGIGEIFDSEGQHYIDITSRGGLASNNAAQQIIVQASGYFYKK
ncbi:hypothetical protein GCM10008090_32030 [Arenicella chitinivorans]|uniref:Uncharacterized protein n=1 Tax=Arenicella chitinivorans TaxID=1329800 RepID=A0A918S201_9GAMM|nr:hypothetical protein GCM10008090_32030 [Arenicella chitinivorans]